MKNYLAIGKMVYKNYNGIVYPTPETLVILADSKNLPAQYNGWEIIGKFLPFAFGKRKALDACRTWESKIDFDFGYGSY